MKKEKLKDVLKIEVLDILQNEVVLERSPKGGFIMRKFDWSIDNGVDLKDKIKLGNAGIFVVNNFRYSLDVKEILIDRNVHLFSGSGKWNSNFPSYNRFIINKIDNEWVFDLYDPLDQDIRSRHDRGECLAFDVVRGDMCVGPDDDVLEIMYNDIKRMEAFDNLDL